MGCTDSKSQSNPAEMGRNKIVHKVVWFFGVPTAGKSWSADFCAKYHDWIHIDGDEELMRQKPENAFMIGKMVQSYEAILACKEPAPGLLEPYLAQLNEKVRAARTANPQKTVCVAFALYLKSSREYIRKITGEPVSFVQIKVTEAEIVARNKPRIADFCKSADKTEAECWVMWGLEKKFGPFDEDSWNKMFLEHNFLKGM